MADGSVLWTNSYSPGDGINAATPVYADGHLFWPNGFTKGAVYSNFTRKSDLFRALLEREAGRAAAEVTPATLQHEVTTVVCALCADPDPRWRAQGLELLGVLRDAPAGTSQREARPDDRGQADLLHQRQHPAAGLGAACAFVPADRLADLVADGQHRRRGPFGLAAFDQHDVGLAAGDAAHPLLRQHR
mgnify:CR=1 FL=1